MGIKKFIAKASHIHNNKYSYEYSEYINYKTKLKIICPQHGEFFQSPHTHVSLKHGCPKCAINKRKMNINEFISKARLIHNNKYSYENTIYIKSDTKVLITCPIHGEFQIRARDHIAGKGCQKCARKNKHNNKLTQNEFVKKAQKIHKNRYNYSKTKYEDSTKRIIITCPIHGDFEQKASSHLRGHGCKKCAIESNKNNLNKFSTKASKIHNNRYDYHKSKYENARTNITIICPKHGSFDQLVSNHLAGSGCPRCPTTISSFHQDVINYISKYKIKLEINNKDMISQEIDIYVPEFKLGIELNGDYWHSWHPHNDKLENKRKHFNKFHECYQNNIKLLQISEHEWINNNTKSIWKSIINHHINKTTNIYYARKCDICSDFQCGDFFDDNHLQGNRGAKIKIGLQYDGKLISAMTFGKNNKYEWEIMRYATIKNSLVTGGASRIFKHFIKNYNPKTIMTYSDLRYSNGNIYKKLGFKYYSTTEPGYVYLKHKEILSRHKCQKHKLKSFLPIFDNNKSESENMFLNKYRRLYNAGNFKFIWNKF